jgi:predicted pyridoxine 5'-phosphate oxidase superfamily flavin-nucleotide-binding protein
MTHETYHRGHRALQDQFDTRRLADRLEQVTMHETFTDDDRAVIEAAPMFFLATADADGWPDCSYKGGRPGFVRVLDERTLAWGDYDGNGQFRSLGNVLVNPRVGMLFVDFQSQDRMRVNGSAVVSADDPLLSTFPGAQLVVRVTADKIFPNCARYIHKMELKELSVYAPAEGHDPPEPKWKSAPQFCDAVPKKK